MAATAPTMALVAGEASGDLLGSLLLQALFQRWPNLLAAGIVGPRMQQTGATAWWPSEKLAVRGYVEVLRHYREIVGIRNAMRERLLSERPDLFIGIDAPDFNLGLAAALRAQGVPTLQMVCPSIWAWRPERIHTIKASCDHVLCLFPFEPDLLAREGIAATYIGHPLAMHIPLETDRSEACAQLGLDAQRPVVAILPGSRASEVQYLAPRFLRAAQRLQQRAGGDLQLVLPTLPHLLPVLQRMVQDVGGVPGLQLIEGQSHAVLQACNVTLIASGTATLEAALYKKPMVIAYAMNPISHWIMKRKQLQPWVGLPNILCQQFIVPELLQKEATSERMADETWDWLVNRERQQALQGHLDGLHRLLRRDTGRLAADAIAQLLARSMGAFSAQVSGEGSLP